ncbi:MAG: OmpH family outer membrane protein [Gammaproteobacteria bacterium]
MKITFKRFLLLSFAAVCLAGFDALAADYKIGVVNAVGVLEAAPQADVARKKLEKEFATRDRELVAAQKSLKGLEDRMVKDGAIMSETERSRLERDIVNKRRELKRDQDEFREDVNFRRNEEFGKIQRDIVEAIREVAKKEKFDLVLGEGVIFASKAVDITQNIIDHLKK